MAEAITGVCLLGNELNGGFGVAGRVMQGVLSFIGYFNEHNLHMVAVELRQCVRA